jgi:hypothetical protein
VSEPTICILAQIGPDSSMTVQFYGLTAAEAESVRTFAGPLIAEQFLSAADLQHAAKNPLGVVAWPRRRIVSDQERTEDPTEVLERGWVTVQSVHPREGSPRPRMVLISSTTYPSGVASCNIHAWRDFVAAVKRGEFDQIAEVSDASH